jgi:hypothetical protein
VGGNPTTATDPTGHRCYNGDGGVCGSPPPTYNPPTTPPTGCHSDNTCPTDNSGDNSHPENQVLVNGTWCKTQLCVQTEKLKELDSSGENWQLAGIGADIASLLVAIGTGNTALAIFEFVALLIDLVINRLIPTIGKIITDHNVSQNGNEWAQNITAGLNEVLGLVMNAIGWIKTANWVMQVAINGAIIVAKTTAEGIPGALEDITLKVLGGAISFVMNGVGDQLQANANAIFAQEAAQQNMSPSDWCSQYDAKECAGLPEYPS